LPSKTLVIPFSSTFATLWPPLGYLMLLLYGRRACKSRKKASAKNPISPVWLKALLYT